MLRRSSRASAIIPVSGGTITRSSMPTDSKVPIWAVLMPL